MRPIDSSFQQVERLLTGIVSRHYRKHGGDWDELLSIAHEAFTEAWHSHNPERAQFTTWVQIQAQNRLKTELRERIRRNRTTIDSDAVQSTPARQETILSRVLAEVSDDARTLLGLAIEQPVDCLLAARRLAWGLHGDRESPARALLELMQNLGWDCRRIFSAWQEIREAL
jgi:DNA-directed RNA polymerase specialized sigma24 family protein